MKYASFAGSLLILLVSCQATPPALPPRLELSRAIASATAEQLRARYVITPSKYGASAVPAPARLLEALKSSGFHNPGAGKAVVPVWSEAVGKAAFFSAGWIWISDREGKSMRSVWFEPDLRAQGSLEWSDDGTQLRLKADGWRHGVMLDLGLETQKTD